MENYKLHIKLMFIILLAVISISGIFSRSLWKPDEPRVAEIGREMWLTHHYAVPTLNQSPFLEKPPLYWWIMSASYEYFGVSDGTARLPSALFGFLTLLFTFLIGKRIGGDKTGVFAALVLATLTEFSIISHRCLVDNALFFFVTLGYYGFFTGYAAEKPRGKWIGYELMALASGLAFLSKGLVGPGLIVAPAVLALLIRRDFREFRQVVPQIGVGILLFLAVVAPWIIELYRVGGKSALQEYLLQNTIGRMLPSAISHYVGGHRHSFAYYFLKLPQDFIPWIIALPATLAFLIHPPESLEKHSRRGLIMALLLFAGGFLLLCLPETKRGLYLVPIYPLLAVGIGGWLAHACNRGYAPKPLERWTLQIILALFAVVPLAVVAGSGFIVLTGIGPRGYDMAPIVKRMTLMLVLIVPLGIIAFLFLANRFLKAFKSKTAPSCLLLFATVIIFFLAYHEGAVRVMNPAKSIHRFTNKMRPYMLAETPIAGYKISELTRAMIPFDTGRFVKVFSDPRDLALFLQKSPGALLVIPKSEAENLPAALKARLEFLTGQDYSRHFKVRLYRVTAAPAGKILQGPLQKPTITEDSSPGNAI